MPIARHELARTNFARLAVIRFWADATAKIEVAHSYRTASDGAARNMALLLKKRGRHHAVRADRAGAAGREEDRDRGGHLERAGHICES